MMLLPSVALAAAIVAQEPFDTDDPLDTDFRLEDLNGKVWDFEAIKGPKGALLHFYRSADW